MVTTSAIILLSSIILVSAQAPPDVSNYKPEFPNYQVQSEFPNYNNRPPVRVRQSGASRIFGWLGSRFAPYFLPRVPQFPRHVPQQQGPSQYQSSVILPEQPSQSQDYKPEANPPETQNQLESSPTYPSYNPEPISQNEIPQESVPDYKNQFEVVPSHMLSYEKEVMPPQGNWQPGFGGIPIASPPLHQMQSGQAPVVPLSMGPDYFNTAYNGANVDSQQMQAHQSQQVNYQNQEQKFQPQQVANQQNIQQTQPQYNFQPPSASPAPQPNNNFGASFGEIQQLPAQPINQNNGFASASFDLNQADFSTLLSNIEAGGSGGQNFISTDGFNIQGSTIVPVSSKPPKKAQLSHPSQKPADGFVASGIPGVQILSQSEDGGNPVFEVLADADAPSFDGHPFDINKLIAMIEPGAVVDSKPELSPSSSETKSVYEAPPSDTGISDLLLSESHLEPSYTTLEGSKSKKPYSTFFSTNKSDSDKNKTSNLKEIMDFFQQTGGKGYVVVEKKRSPLNLTDALTPDDDLTEGFSRLNITSETLPLLNKETGNTLTYSIIPHGASPEPKFTSPIPNPTFSKPYQFKPAGPRKPFLSRFSTSTTPRPITIPVKFANITSPTVFFAVRATTQHPNHNYNPNSSFHIHANQIPIPTFSSVVNSVNVRAIDNPNLIRPDIKTDDDDDLSAAESQVKSIAITVTPPPHLTSSSTTPIPPTDSIPVTVTKKSVSSSTSSKKRPAPVYRRKIVKTETKQ